MNRLELDSVEWKEFFIGGKEGLFNIRSTNSGIDKNKLLETNGDIPYVTRSNLNNGIDIFVGEKQNTGFSIDRGNVITIGLDTQTVFYQPKNFFTGQNIQIVENKLLNKEIALFLVPLLKIQMRKFSWGSTGATLTRLNRTKILLPVDSNGNPNWRFMEDYIKRKQKEQAQKIVNYYKQRMIEYCFELLDFENVEWKEFKFEKIFKKIQRGKRLTKSNQIEGNTPYISSTAMNNGVDNFINNEDNVRKFKNCLTVANSGSVGACFYHHYEFVASDHVTSLKLKDENNADKYIYLFISSIIKRLEEKYSFNREINDKRIRQEKIILPVDKNGNPHWQYMRMVMKKIESEKISKVVEHLINTYIN